ncbi:MAG: serine/threonine protein kinase [Bacteroidales bacterium]|nr:serine/threonine protein kinase [Bacteroidales bacterium]
MSEPVSETLREIGPELDFGGQYTILSTFKEGRLYIASKAGKRLLLKTSDGSAKGLEQLKREYELSIGLSHPGLAYVFTYEEETPVGPCIVQEFVDGETLTDWVAHNPSKKERRRICAELLSVMAYLHRKGVIHNDLKPDNILIGRSSGSVKLIDFGFADDDTHVAKALGGTRQYAAPELIKDGRADARSDVYSIGIILRDIFSTGYGRIINRCLQNEPAKRYASAAELERAWKRRHLPLWVSLVAAVVITLGCLTYAFISTQKELSSLKEAESARTDALSAAKSEVDAWYDAEVPAFLDALSRATSRSEANAAWAAFAEKTASINTDLPARIPEDIRPALRDYVFQRYNDTFPALQDSLIQRMNELSK